RSRTVSMHFFASLGNTRRSALRSERSPLHSFRSLSAEPTLELRGESAQLAAFRVAEAPLRRSGVRVGHGGASPARPGSARDCEADRESNGGTPETGHR